jgi:nucleoside-diphosphate-sugar epimerase
MSKLIFGCGYLGQRVARRWLDAGDEVYVTTRSEARGAEFAQQGFKTIIADVTQPRTLRRLPDAGTVLFAVGHDRGSGQSIQEVYSRGLRNVLDALAPNTCRLIYISTTGVYGPGDGGWVDENTSPDPQRDGGRASLAAEQVLANHSLGSGSIILRLAGIYGPDRIPFLNELRSGQQIAAPATGWLNLIHIDDAAAVVVAADELPPFENGPLLYCVSDGVPIARGEFYAEVAQQIRARPPQFGEPEPNSPRARRAEANRRVNNARMLADLHVTLTYRDFRAGLSAILGT